MSFFKKFGLAIGAIAFCLSLSVAASYAQPGKARWSGNNGKHKGWTKGQRNGWNRGRKTGWNKEDRYNRRYSRYSRDNRYNEYDRYDRFNRYGSYDNYGYNPYGGRISPREARRIARQRERIYNTRDRYYRNGYILRRERRNLGRQTPKYRQNVRRDRRYW